MRKILPLFISTLLLGWVCPYDAVAEIPAGYYQAAVGKKSQALKTSLSSIIYKSSNAGYDGLYTVYKKSDIRADGKVWDMYSNITNFDFSKTCGQYAGEGDCFNREHTVPQSWFSKSAPMKSDAWHVIPTDGKINNMRGSDPFGEVGEIKHASANNFSKSGSSKTPGYSGTVFEPNDLYKGDVARMYFYMATCYEKQVGNWGGGVFSSSYPHLKEWTLNLMLKWHRQDPVSQKEITRNEAIYESRQNNRNPFVDYPELVELIFGDRQNEVFDPENMTPGEPTDPDEPKFELLEATNITPESFIVNWVSKKDADNYKLTLYTKEYSDIPPTTVFDYIAQSTIPTGWAKTGFSQYEAAGWRLASGSSSGTLTTADIDLSDDHQLILTSSRYKTDRSILKISLNGNQIHSIVYEDELERTDTIVIKGAGAKDKITFSASADERVYLHQIALKKGKEASVIPVNGYPVLTGNVTSYPVNNLKEQTDYYYYLTPVTGSVEGEPSAVKMTTTTLGNSIGSTYEEDNVITFVNDGKLSILNAPHNAQIRIIAMTGKTVAQYRAIQEEETFDLPFTGVYLLEIKHPSIHICRKILL